MALIGVGEAEQSHGVLAHEELGMHMALLTDAQPGQSGGRRLEGHADTPDLNDRPGQRDLEDGSAQ